MSIETARSKPHQRIEKMLTRMGLDFHSEHEEFQPYSLDIYLTEWHLCVEIDGPNHSPAANLKRDRRLREDYGVPTLRIQGGELSEELAPKLRDFIEYWADSTPERKALARR